jgi:phytoene/squalene synthetase
MLSPSIRDAIYSIYGFVRFADEIVDSFHGYDKEVLIDDFEKEYYKALWNQPKSYFKFFSTNGKGVQYQMI